MKIVAFATQNVLNLIGIDNKKKLLTKTKQRNVRKYVTLLLSLGNAMR